MSNIHEFTNKDELMQKFVEVQENGPFILILTGSGTWCPDCVAAKDQIKKVMTGNTTVPILVGIVDRDEWVGKQHFYKTHATIKAAGVPTMCILEGETCLQRVDDVDNFKNDDLMQMFIELA